MSARKHVTWSPVVASVYRPTSIGKARRRTASVIVIESGTDRRTVRGNLVAHARRDAHNTLLTIRNAQHRQFQMLIDMPARRVHKVYDGQNSYKVDLNARNFMTIRFVRFGTIVWKDDNDAVRRPDARGFCVAWLRDTPKLPVRLAKKSHRTRSKIRSRKR